MRDMEDLQTAEPLLSSSARLSSPARTPPPPYSLMPDMESQIIFEIRKVDLADAEAANGDICLDLERDVAEKDTKNKASVGGTLLGDEEAPAGAEEEEDPWALAELKDTGTPWKELSCCMKLRYAFVNWFFKPIFIVTLLYFFICSLDLMSSAFRLLGGKEAGEVFAQNDLLNNPICGLMIGILATVLVQSSSTSTSIVVTIVAAGILPVRPAIYIVMGANIGTSVTNTIVSMAQSGNRAEFRRAFGGATVHDMFNWLCVICLLPLEAATGYLYLLTSKIVDSFHIETNEDVKVELLKVLTKPFSKKIIQIDSKKIAKIATGEIKSQGQSLLKVWCEKEKVPRIVNETVGALVANSTGVAPTADGFNATTTGYPLWWDATSSTSTPPSTNTTSVAATTSIATTDVAQPVTEMVEIGVEKCHFLFNGTGLSDRAIGGILLVIALVMLCGCLIMMVKTLNSLLKGRVAGIIRRTINADFPGPFSFLTGYFAILVGAGVTFLVQSSSVFTSAMTPLVGVGVITLDRMYPLTLGSNIGTTATGLLAAMASSGDKLENSIQIALCHLFFNISGILIWYPIPVMRKVPILLAKKLGNTTAKYRWFAIMYLILMFFVLPLTVFGLSLISIWCLVAIGSPLILLAIFIVVVNVLQTKKPHFLPEKLRTWDFLPLCLHSLAPLDHLISKMLQTIKNCCPCNKNSKGALNVSGQPLVNSNGASPVKVHYDVVNERTDTLPASDLSNANGAERLSTL
ncbi:sodium-dependent phosphate transport protein 2C-like [Diadema antillarum]|uniref:sodium-dependent phosphate transport protein 2C-like n=1 Tax=Diadema antillarum TaxID=105358 RepID=UPI003A8C5FB7